MAPLSQATFNARLHRQLVLHNGVVGEAERTYQEAVNARALSAESHRDGTGALVITGDGPRISAAACRVDEIARGLRKNGDERTLDQLRADVATDLLMGGWIPGDPTFTALGRPDWTMASPHHAALTATFSVSGLTLSYRSRPTYSRRWKGVP